MDISVCIPTYNASQRILPTLKAIENSLSKTIECEKIEILVVGNACDDDTRHVVESFWKELHQKNSRRFVEEPKLGLTNARLRAFHDTKSEVLIFCDDDVIPDQDAFHVIADAARAEKSVGAGGGVILPQLLDRAEWPEWIDNSLRSCLALRDFFEKPVYSPPNEHGRWYPVGAFVWFRRHCLSAWAKAVSKRSFLLDRTGTKKWSAGDLEMDHYVIDSGYQIKLDPAIKAWHRIPPERLTPDYFRSLMYWIGRSMQRLRNRRNSKAWNYSCGHLLSFFRTDPVRFIRQFSGAHKPLRKRLPFDPYIDSKKLNELLHLAYKIGMDDEILVKFLNPKRF